MTEVKVKLLHARYRHYDGNLPKGLSTLACDPNNLGIEVMIVLDEMIERGENNCLGTSLEGVIVRHHKKGNDYYHNVFVAATSEQWEAAKKYWESGAFD